MTHHCPTPFRDIYIALRYTEDTVLAGCVKYCAIFASTTVALAVWWAL